MKFINYLESISGVSVYPMASLIIFFGFFTGLLLYVTWAKKEDMDARRNMPINDSEHHQTEEL